MQAFDWHRMAAADNGVEQLGQVRLVMPETHGQIILYDDRTRTPKPVWPFSRRPTTQARHPCARR